MMMTSYATEMDLISIFLQEFNSWEHSLPRILELWEAWSEVAQPNSLFFWFGTACPSGFCGKSLVLCCQCGPLVGVAVPNHGLSPFFPMTLPIGCQPRGELFWKGKVTSGRKVQLFVVGAQFEVPLAQFCTILIISARQGPSKLKTDFEFSEVHSCRKGLRRRWAPYKVVKFDKRNIIFGVCLT